MIIKKYVIPLLCTAIVPFHLLGAENNDTDVQQGANEYATHRLPKLTVIPNLAVYAFQAKTAQINGPVTVNGPVRVEGALTINGRSLTSSGLTEIPLSIANGGINATTMSNVDGVVYYDGIRLNTTTTGATDTVLLGNGIGIGPSFGTVPNGALANDSITLTNGTNINITGSPVALGGNATINVSIPGATADGVVYYTGTALSTTSAGTSHYLLTSNGSGSAPSFQPFTINTDSGSVTGNTLSLSATGAGDTVKFSSSGTTMALTVTDSNNNTVVGSLSVPGLGTNNTVFGEGSLSGGSGPSSNNCLFGQGVISNLGNQSVSNNCVFGQGAGSTLVTGNSNIIIGINGGDGFSLSATGNICIGAAGNSGDNNTLRIGASVTKAFIGGINGVTTGVSNAVPVLVDSNGQLGTASSSGRYKKNIQGINVQETRLLELRPVTFNYKQENASDELHFGLIAEEVEEVIPDLVIRDSNGDVQTVKYHELPALLLAHIKQLAVEITALKEDVAVLEATASIAKKGTYDY